MKLKLFTVYDSKAESYMPPFNMGSTGTAVRSFGDTCKNPEHAFAQHPEDYTLFEIGEFDDQTATLTMHETKISLGSANEYIGEQS